MYSKENLPLPSKLVLVLIFSVICLTGTSLSASLITFDRLFDIGGSASDSDLGFDLKRTFRLSFSIDDSAIQISEDGFYFRHFTPAVSNISLSKLGSFSSWSPTGDLFATDVKTQHAVMATGRTTSDRLSIHFGSSNMPATNNGYEFEEFTLYLSGHYGSFLKDPTSSALPTLADQLIEPFDFTNPDILFTSVRFTFKESENSFIRLNGLPTDTVFVPNTASTSVLFGSVFLSLLFIRFKLRKPGN